MLLRCSSICSILSKDKDGDKTNWLSFPADVPFIFKPFFFCIHFYVVVYSLDASGSGNGQRKVKDRR